LSEIAVPTGQVRVANDTHDLLHVPEMPGRDDVLVVVGKTGSRRGEWSYGEWFRGHPSKCEISFFHKGTARKLKSVTLNGKVQETNYVQLSLWTDPKELAKRALQEAGVESTTERIDALAEVYRQKAKEEAPKPVAEAAIVSNTINEKVEVVPESKPSNRQSYGGIATLSDAFDRVGL